MCDLIVVENPSLACKVVGTHHTCLDHDHEHELALCCERRRRLTVLRPANVSFP